MCYSEPLTAKGSPLYFWNNDYPSGPIRASSTSCSCSVEASSCNSQINVYFVHFELGDGGGSCSGNQNIEIEDKGSIHTCSQNSLFEITIKMTSLSSYITVMLNNAAAIGDGKFWLGFEGKRKIKKKHFQMSAVFMNLLNKNRKLLLNINFLPCFYM